MTVTRASRTLTTSVILALGMILGDGVPCRAQSQASPPPRPGSPGGDTAEAAALLNLQAARLVAALQDYRATLDGLLAVRERALANAIERYAPRRDLYRRGIMSRRELEDGERAVATARQAVDDTRREIEAADQATAEAATLETLAVLPPPATDSQQHTTAFLRYGGAAGWLLQSGTPKLQRVFAARFGRALPVSAFGQTPLHDRMGLDHRNALDIAVHPDSPEGRVLIDYLRTEGIPFIASWGAMPGSSSGAHIHVGLPSPRITTRR